VLDRVLESIPSRIIMDFRGIDWSDILIFRVARVVPLRFCVRRDVSRTGTSLAVFKKFNLDIDLTSLVAVVRFQSVTLSFYSDIRLFSSLLPYSGRIFG